MIIPKYQQTLSMHSKRQNKSLPLTQISRTLYTAILLIEKIEKIHAKGFVFNNISPYNILIDEMSNLELTNFEYMTKLGKSIDPNNYPNFGFQSISLLKGKTPTFMDDIKSIFYVIVYLLCDQKHMSMHTFLCSSGSML